MHHVCFLVCLRFFSFYCFLDALYASHILDGNIEYLEQLQQWLHDEIDWRLCYRAFRDGWRSTMGRFETIYVLFVWSTGCGGWIPYGHKISCNCRDYLVSFICYIETCVGSAPSICPSVSLLLNSVFLYTVFLLKIQIN